MYASFFQKAVLDSTFDNFERDTGEHISEEDRTFFKEIFSSLEKRWKNGENISAVMKQFGL